MGADPTPEPREAAAGDAPATAPPQAEGTRRPARVSSAQLFQGATELQIEHRGALYRLRQTALGKLILTK
jgi:hemin uptake protein HemP